MPVDYEELIPSLTTFSEEKTISVSAWLMNVGTYELAIAFGTLFSPNFKLVGDCVFRRSSAALGAEAALATSAARKSDLEALHNHLHINDLFWNVEATDAQERHLGAQLKSAWAA